MAIFGEKTLGNEICLMRLCFVYISILLLLHHRIFWSFSRMLQGNIIVYSECLCSWFWWSIFRAYIYWLDSLGIRARRIKWWSKVGFLLCAVVLLDTLQTKWRPAWAFTLCSILLYMPPILYFDTIFQYLHCCWLKMSFEVYISCKSALKTTTISSALKATSFKIYSMRLSFFKFNYSLISCMS